MLNIKFETSLSNKKVNLLTSKLFKTKKGISPILATLLLVVIAVAAIVVTYAWVMTYTTHLTGQASVVLFNAQTSFENNGTTIYLDIGNSGTVDTTIVEAYVGTSPSSMDNQTVTPPAAIVAGAQPNRITVTYSWQTGVTYYFKVIASTGQYLSWSSQAPSSYS